jgi:hypothetical protein
MALKSQVSGHERKPSAGPAASASDEVLRDVLGVEAVVLPQPGSV